MAARKTEESRAVSQEWRGFPGRLRYAIEQRKAETPELTQNDIAKKAGIDGGNLSKYLSGKKAAGVTANTVIELARALRVHPAWLLLGQEPSGLQSHAEPPDSQRRPSVLPRK